MFCTHCAAEVLSIATNFCYSCGKELNIKADEPKSEMSDDSSAVSANDLITEMFHRGYPQCYRSFTREKQLQNAPDNT